MVLCWVTTPNDATLRPSAGNDGIAPTCCGSFWQRPALHKSAQQAWRQHADVVVGSEVDGAGVGVANSRRITTAGDAAKLCMCGGRRRSGGVCDCASTPPSEFISERAHSGAALRSAGDSWDK